MNPKQRLRLLLPALLVFSALPLSAQHVLMADYGGKLTLVEGALENEPCILKDGKLKAFPTTGYALRSVPEYLPVFVSVEDVFAQVSYVTTMSEGGAFNMNLHYGAAFRSDFRLKNVFLVLVIETELGRKSIFLAEVGTLQAGKRFPFSTTVPFNMAPTDKWGYTLHLFAGGAEVFQSEIPAMEQNRALDRMVALRVKGIQASPPSVLFATAPVYPKELRSQKLQGRAVVTALIGVNGEVKDASVKSASEPAFGLAAVESVKAWRFVPKVVDSAPVESRASIPVAFDPSR